MVDAVDDDRPGLHDFADIAVPLEDAYRAGLLRIGAARTGNDAEQQRDDERRTERLRGHLLTPAWRDADDDALSKYLLANVMNVGQVGPGV